MNNIEIDLSKLHGFRLLAIPGEEQRLTEIPPSLTVMLGARLGSKIGDPKVTSQRH